MLLWFTLSCSLDIFSLETWLSEGGEEHCVCVLPLALPRELTDVTWFFSGLGSPDSILKMVAVELSLLTMALLVHPVFKVSRVQPVLSVNALITNLCCVVHVLSLYSNSCGSPCDQPCPLSWWIWCL